MNRNKRISTLTVLLLGLIFANCGLLFIQFSSNDPIINNNKNNNNNLIDYRDNTPRSAVGDFYTSDFNGTGKNINITLHQSILNTSSISFSNLDNGNTFTEPFPNFSGYNTSFVNISIDNIYAPNKTLIIEDDSGGQVPLGNYYTSFQVKGDCYLENISVEIFTSGIATTFTFDVYGAIQDGSNAKYDISNDLTGASNLGTLYNDTTTPFWYNLTKKHIYLDVDNTYDNTFFIRISSDNSQGFWRSEDESDGDDTYSWLSGGASPLLLTDLTLKVGLSPNGQNNDAKPTDIKLEINNTAVSDITNGVGYWNPLKSYNSTTNQLEFEIMSDWYDVSCDITQVQINYTKPDLLATSEFDVLVSDQDVLWNVTRNGGLNYFDSRLNNYTINFTIPSTWNDVEVWNGGTNKTDDIVLDPLGNGYTEAQVLNAGNGTFWFLNASSNNLVQSIDIYDVNFKPIGTANYSDTVYINTTFDTKINSEKGTDQGVNLSIYSPEALNNLLNYTFINATFNKEKIELGNWTIKKNVTQYGNFRVQVWWNNGTAAGFNETILTIYGETELQPTLPDTIFDASDTFDLIVYFNDTKQNLPVIGADINYSINSSPWRYDKVVDENNGSYTITIDCNDTDFYDSGLNSIMINASQQYFNNDNITVEFTILGETNLDIENVPDKPLYTSSETFNITAYYNNTVRNKGIDGATNVTVEINYILYSDAIIFDNQDGYYNISIKCNATQFGQYGSKSIRVNISKTNYHNQSRELTVNIEGKSSLPPSIYPDIPVYDSSDTFNITVFFNDTARNVGIDGATIDVEINNIEQTQIDIDPFNIGKYNITVNCSDDLFNQYGPSIITINASKIYFDNATVDINVDIRGNTTLQVTKAPETSYTSKEIFNITVYFNDTARNSYITGADLTIEVNETIYNTYWLDLLNGFYNITINCSDSIFAAKGYGYFNVRINSSKIYFYNKSKEVGFNIGAETDLTYSLYPNRYTFDSNELFNITVFYNDTAQNEGIDQANIIVEINGVVYDDFSPDNYAKGLYNITINCSAIEWNDYGMGTINISASKPNFNYQEIFVIPNVQITGITELNLSRYPIKTYYSSSEFINITAYFNDTSRNQGINGATIEVKINGIIYTQHSLDRFGLGYYNITIDLDNNFFETNGYGLFNISINASKIYYYEDIVNISIFVVGNTTINTLIPSEDIQIVEGTIFNITVDFRDYEHGSDIIGATIYYTLNGTDYRSDKWGDNLDGTYNITIDSGDSDFADNYGFRYIIINVSLYKFINQSISFRIERQIQTSINPYIGVNFGNIFRSEIRSYTFNYSDNQDNPIVGATVSNITSLEGFTWQLIVEGDGNYTISLNSTGVTDKAYSFQFRVNATGNQTQIILIQINVLKPNTKILDFTTNIVNLIVPLGFNLTLNFNFTDALNNIGIDDPNFDTRNVTVKYQGATPWDSFVNNSNGDVNFPNGGWLLFNNGNGNYTLNISTLLIPGNFYSITITIEYASSNPGLYNSSIITLEFYYASAPAIPSDGGGGGGGGGGTRVTGIPFETLVLYIIIIAAVVGTVAAIVGIQKGVIAPKKREKERILREVTTIFDDAINLEHILVIYKTSGTCVFFKSYGMEEIDPELISGFLSAVSSFGREMDSQEALNEIQYGDKMLLLADGEFIRVALVLDKQASIILRQHLKEFIDFYEEKYASSLPNWRGQLAAFRDSGELIDRVFSTSIILPHQVNYDATKVKALKSPHSKDVLKIASSLVAEDSDKKYFFIATLLVEATDKTGKEKAEVFMGIKELRDNNILTPIEIAAIEKPPITQQELDLIRQQVNDLPDLSEEEIVEITNNLAKMGPAEREAYLASSRERAVVVSAPIKTTVGTVVIDNIKSAKKEIKNLKKLANTTLKMKNTQSAIEIFNNAAVIATNWDLTKEFEELEDIIRITTINDLKAGMKVLESEAKVAAKAGDYPEATQKYAQAARAASEIFKLGITEMTKEVKRLTNKSKEYERLS